ncbi:MAG: hypothetical protein EXS51_00060 [Candidatus Taylorbacteria bacterium]|nr:hypothetical protein [Candidatus Taylorbacteria bacterium]
MKQVKLDTDKHLSLFYPLQRKAYDGSKQQFHPQPRDKPVKKPRIEIRIGLSGPPSKLLKKRRLHIGATTFTLREVRVKVKRGFTLPKEKELCHFLVHRGKHRICVYRLDYTPPRVAGKRKIPRVDESFERRNGHKEDGRAADIVRNAICFMLTDLARAGRASWLGRVGN